MLFDVTTTFPEAGGGGARFFLLDLFGPTPVDVIVLMVGEIGLSDPGLAHPDPELKLLSPAL